MLSSPNIEAPEKILFNLWDENRTRMPLALQ